MSLYPGPRPLPPAWPRWSGEGTPCVAEGCVGRRYVVHPLDGSSGLDTWADWARCCPGRAPTDDDYAGEWRCPECGTRGAIGLGEVLESADHALHTAGPLGLLLAGGGA